jgi:hypothetical protein
MDILHIASRELTVASEKIGKLIRTNLNREAAESKAVVAKLTTVKKYIDGKVAEWDNPR